MLGLLAPVTAQIPAGDGIRGITAILLLVAICFVVGLIVRTRPGRTAKDAFENAVLEKLPGYSFIRNFTKRLTGRSEEQTLQPALVELEDALVPALIVEVLEDGSYTVLVPSAPTPMAGSIYILPADRVHPVDIPLTKAIGVFSKWGTGAGEFVRAMKKAGSSSEDLALVRAGEPSATRPPEPKMIHTVPPADGRSGYRTVCLNGGQVGPRQAHQASKRRNQRHAEPPAVRTRVPTLHDVLESEGKTGVADHPGRSGRAGCPAMHGVLVIHTVSAALAAVAVEQISRHPYAGCEVVGEMRFDAE